MARASSKGAPAKAAASTASGRGELGVLLLVALAIPRFVRLFYPAIWVEDDFYLEAAWLVSAGMRPYLDFVHPHFPLLEFISAAYLKIFGASHFSIEILNEAAIYATSLLTFKLAARVGTRRAATSAAILYASSSLVFRYHVYERECFVAPLLLIAAIVALDDDWPAGRRFALQAVVLTAACLIKLTAGIAVAAILVFMVLVQRRWRDALALAIAVGFAIIIATGFCYILYGRDFVLQTLVFHFMKGSVDFGWRIAYPLKVLDIQIPLFVVGCVAIRRRLRDSHGLILAMMMVTVEYLFYGVLSPTSWAHNFLEPLPFIAILGGIGVDWMIAQASASEWLPFGAAASLIVVSMLWVAPLENENWMQGSVYGFGFIPRKEVARVGAALHDASGPNDDVLAPAFICFQANRRELIRFPETYGVLREAELEYERDGFAAARDHLGNENFFSLIAETAHFWRDPILNSIQDRKLNAIVPDSPIQLLPLVIPPVLLPPDFAQVLVDNGFKPVAQTEHFVLWRRGK